MGSLLADENLDIFQETNAQKDHLTVLLEINSYEYLCRMQYEPCLRKSTEYYSKIPEIYFLYPNDEVNP